MLLLRDLHATAPPLDLVHQVADLPPPGLRSPPLVPELAFPALPLLPRLPRLLLDVPAHPLHRRIVLRRLLVLHALPPLRALPGQDLRRQPRKLLPRLPGLPPPDLDLCEEPALQRLVLPELLLQLLLLALQRPQVVLLRLELQPAHVQLFPHLLLELLEALLRLLAQALLELGARPLQHLQLPLEHLALAKEVLPTGELPRDPFGLRPLLVRLALEPRDHPVHLIDGLLVRRDLSLEHVAPVQDGLQVTALELVLLDLVV